MPTCRFSAWKTAPTCYLSTTTMPLCEINIQLKSVSWEIAKFFCQHALLVNSDCISPSFHCIVFFPAHFFFYHFEGSWQYEWLSNGMRLYSPSNEIAHLAFSACSLTVTAFLKYTRCLFGSAILFEKLVRFHTLSRQAVTTQQTFRLLLVAFDDTSKSMSKETFLVFSVFLVSVSPFLLEIFPFCFCFSLLTTSLCLCRRKRGNCAVMWLQPSIKMRQLRYCYRLHFIWTRFIYEKVKV